MRVLCSYKDDKKSSYKTKFLNNELRKMSSVFGKQTFNNALQLPGEMTFLSLLEAN